MIVNERTSRLYRKKRDIECILKIISQDNAVYDILLGILATVKKDIREDNHMNMMIQQCREQELHKKKKDILTNEKFCKTNCYQRSTQIKQCINCGWCMFNSKDFINEKIEYICNIMPDQQENHNIVNNDYVCKKFKRKEVKIN